MQIDTLQSQPRSCQYQFVFKILSGNEVGVTESLTTCKQYTRPHPPPPPILRMRGYKNTIQNLVKFHQFVLKILSGNEILTSIKDHSSVIHLRKLTCNNPNLDLVNAYSKFGQIPSIRSQDIEHKRSRSDVITDNL